MRNLFGACFLAAVAASLWSVTASADTSVGEFSGRWTITDIVGYSDTSGGIPEARKLLGKIVIISQGEIDIGGLRCKPRDGFRITEATTASKFPEYYGVTPTDAGLPALTRLLDSNECTPVFQLGANRVVLGWNGVVVRAIKESVPKK